MDIATKEMHEKAVTGKLTLEDVENNTLSAYILLNGKPALVELDHTAKLTEDAIKGCTPEGMKNESVKFVDFDRISRVAEYILEKAYTDPNTLAVVSLMTIEGLRGLAIKLRKEKKENETN